MSSTNVLRAWHATLIGLTIVSGAFGSLWAFGPRAAGVTYFSDMLEPTPLAGWNATSNGAGTVWEWGTPAAGPLGCNSGVNCFGTNLNSSYTNGAVATLISPSIDLTAATSAYLHFWHWYSTESCCDPITVSVSADGGVSWTPLATWAGNGMSWRVAEYDLSAWVGGSVLVRFVLSTDGSVISSGWYLDDVVVDDVPPALCPGLTTLLDDTPITCNSPPNDFAFDVLSFDEGVIGMRPPAGADYDLSAYADTTFATLVETSASGSSSVDLISFDKSVWNSPPTRGGRVTAAMGSGDYVIEMENSVSDRTFGAVWLGSMDLRPGGVEVLDGSEMWGPALGSTYLVTLTVPPTLDLDIFLFDYWGDSAQSRAQATWSSTNVGLGVNESFTFTPNQSGYHMLVVTNENGGTGTYTVSTGLLPGTLTVTPTVIAPAGAEQGQTEVPILRLDLTAVNGTVTVDSFDVDLSGLPPSAADVSLVELWRDNGDGTFSAASDAWLASGSFPAAFLNPGNFDVTPGAPVTVFLTFDLAASAVVGNYVGARLVDETYVNLAWGMIDPANFPIDTYSGGVRTQVTAVVVDSLDVSATVVAPFEVEQGQADVAMLRLTLSTAGSSVDVNTVRVQLTGSPPSASDINRVELWEDDGDGTFDPLSDALLDWNWLSGSPPETTLWLGRTVWSGTPVVVFIVFDIWWGATVDDWVGAHLVDETYIAVSWPDTVSPAGFGFDSYQAGVRTHIRAYNNPPVLGWTGETNYWFDGLDPQSGTTSDAYVYRILYSDADGHAPVTGEPRLHVLRGGTELASSPFRMNFAAWQGVTGDYSAGVIYTYTLLLNLCGNGYTYSFSATDVEGKTATPTPTLNAPDVTCPGNPPVLSATGETNYTADGLDPETGDETTVFTYRVNYSDADDDPPLTGFPRAWIFDGGLPIAGAPFTMTAVNPADTDYTDGAWYTFSTGLPAGFNYEYVFEADDGTGASASVWPFWPNWPDVSAAADNPPVLTYTMEAGFDDPVNPNAGTTTSSYVFRVSYSDADGQPPQTGWPKLFVEKGGMPIVGSPFIMTEVDPSDTNVVDGKWYVFTFGASQLAAGTDYRVSFNATDGVAWAAGPATAWVDAPDITLAPGGLTGTVRIDKIAQAGLTVTLKSGGNVISTTTTDANGVYTFTGLTPGGYTVEVSLTGYNTASNSVSVVGGQNLVADLTLTPLTGTIRGVVREGEAAFAGATVELVDATGAVVRTATTGNDGSYRFAEVPLGTYTVRVRAEGYDEKSSTVALTETERTATADVPMVKAGTVLGMAWWLLAVLAAAIVAGLFLVLFFLRRRKPTPAAAAVEGAPVPAPRDATLPPPPDQAAAPTGRVCDNCGLYAMTAAKFCVRCGTQYA